MGRTRYMRSELEKEAYRFRREVDLDPKRLLSFAELQHEASPSKLEAKISRILANQNLITIPR